MSVLLGTYCTEIIASEVKMRLLTLTIYSLQI